MDYHNIDLGAIKQFLAVLSLCKVVVNLASQFQQAQSRLPSNEYIRYKHTCCFDQNASNIRERQL